MLSGTTLHKDRKLSEFFTSYPRRFSIVKGFQEFIRKEEIEMDHLSLTVKTKKDEIIRMLIAEGFSAVRLENKKPLQIGSGFSKRLGKPWEMHVRLFQMQQGLIAIQAEVEISRKYIQHIRSVRVPVIYEIQAMLEKHRIEYRIWNEKLRDYIISVIDNHQIKLRSPRLPPISWKHMVGYALSLSFVYFCKFVGFF